jgi:hypothetical protein
MREKADYRENLAQLRERTNGKMLISVYEAAKILGVNPKALLSTQEILDMSVEIGKQRRIPVTGLARWMS